MSSDNNQFGHEEITPEEIAAAQRTAYALGQLQGEERAEVERQLANEASQREVDGIKSLAAVLSAARVSEQLSEPTLVLRSLRSAIQLQQALNASKEQVEPKVRLPKRTSVRQLTWIIVGTSACGLLIALLLPAVQSSREARGGRRLVMS